MSWRLANMSRSYCSHLGAPITAVLPSSTDDAAYIIIRADNSLCHVRLPLTGQLAECYDRLHHENLDVRLELTLAQTQRGHVYRSAAAPGL